MKRTPRTRGFRRAAEAAGSLELPARRRRELLLAGAWRRIAGEAVARRAPVEAVRRGVLEIRVPDVQWAAAIRELVPTLAGRLAASYPELGVRRFRLRVEQQASRSEPVPRCTPVPEPTGRRPIAPAGPAPPQETRPADTADSRRRLERVARRYLRRARPDDPR